jgi:hypothetical protein
MNDSGLYTLVDYGHTKPLKLSIDGHKEMEMLSKPISSHLTPYKIIDSLA